MFYAVETLPLISVLRSGMMVNKNSLMHITLSCKLQEKSIKIKSPQSFLTGIKAFTTVVIRQCG